MALSVVSCVKVNVVGPVLAVSGACRGRFGLAAAVSAIVDVVAVTTGIATVGRVGSDVDGRADVVACVGALTVLGGETDSRPVSGMPVVADAGTVTGGSANTR